MGAWARFLVVAAVGLFASSTPARACEDAGPYNDCNDGGAAWIRCYGHTDCPTGQFCGVSGICRCTPCADGEICTDAGCHCAPPPAPTAAPGCTVVEGGCGGDFIEWDVYCDAGPPPAPQCSTDGGPLVACMSDADCAGYSSAGVAWVCSSRGACDCPSDAGAATVPMDAGIDASTGASHGCAVVGARPGSSLPALFVVGLAVAVGRRRRR